MAFLNRSPKVLLQIKMQLSHNVKFDKFSGQFNQSPTPKLGVLDAEYPELQSQSSE